MAMAQIIPFLRKPMATPVNPAVEKVRAAYRRMFLALAWFVALVAGLVWMLAFAVLMMGW